MLEALEEEGRREVRALLSLPDQADCCRVDRHCNLPVAAPELPGVHRREGFGRSYCAGWDLESLTSTWLA